MTRQTVIRRVEESTTDPVVSPIVTEQSGSGRDWVSTSGRWRVGLTNSTPNSKTITWKFAADYRKADSVYNIPATRCIARYKFAPKIPLTSNSGGLGVNYNITYSGTYGTQNYSYFTSAVYSIGTIYQTGSDITTLTANQNVINTTDSTLSAQINTSNSNSNGLHAVTLDIIPSGYLQGNTGPAGSLQWSWEADNIIIDGLDGDSLLFNTVTATISAIGGFRFYGSSTINSSSTMLATANVTKFAESDSTSSSTFTIAPSFKLGFTKSLLTNVELLASVDNLVRLDPLTLTSVVSSSITPTFKPSIGTSPIQSAISTDLIGNMIYDIAKEYSWDTIAELALQNDYKWDSRLVWDDWDDSIWGEDIETWDGWDLDTWDRPYGIAAFFNTTETPSFKIGSALSVTGNFTLVENSALEEPGRADLTAAFTTEFTAQGVIDVSLAIDSAFAPSLTASIIYDTGDTPIAITGAFTPVMTASAITDTFADISTAFTFAVTPTHRPGPYQLNLQSEVTDFDIAPTFKPAGFSDMLAFAAELATSRLFFSADPYNIYTIEKETRIAVIAKENRQTIIDQEKRVNIINDETRTYLVPQETRNLTIVRPPFKNRYSIPRTRAEA